jgi:glycosyltransferase involved in cell wall biosynthesis
MKILFVHPNMPGQYKHLCQAFAREGGHEIVFLTKREDVNIPGVKRLSYKPGRDPSTGTHRYIVNAERGVLIGQEVWRMCKRLRQEGFIPDVICAHPGWGDTLFIKDIFPESPLLGFFEFYYNSIGSDVGFDPEDPLTEDDKARVRIKNIINLQSLVDADWGLTPTWWQYIQHPKDFRHKISVLHDGVNTEAAQPDDSAMVQLGNGLRLTKQDKVVTYIARNFEPYRGFPTFMKSLDILLKEHPDCQVIAVGADGISYGKRAPGSKTYRQIYLEQAKFDRSRVHFVGQVPYTDLMRILQISSAHIYLTFPFVLSWSMLESMACGCIVIGSRTSPVEEVIRDGENGFLVDFFSPEELAAKVGDVLNRQEELKPLRVAARQFVKDRYDLAKLLPLHRELVRQVAQKQPIPEVTAQIAALYDRIPDFRMKPNV